MPSRPNRKGEMSGSRAVLFLALLFLPPGLAAQSGRGDISGYVKLSGPDNNRLRVTVEITRLGDRPEHHTMDSDSGDIYHRYAFKDVRMGEYTVRISAPGYVSYETTLLIGSDFQGVLAVCLRRKGETPDRSSPSQCG